VRRVGRRDGSRIIDRPASASINEVPLVFGYRDNLNPRDTTGWRFPSGASGTRAATVRPAAITMLVPAWGSESEGRHKPQVHATPGRPGWSQRDASRMGTPTGFEPVCRPPAAWDHLGGLSARNMGPPQRRRLPRTTLFVDSRPGARVRVDSPSLRARRDPSTNDPECPARLPARAAAHR
jgi:hypothetical protein